MDLNTEPSNMEDLLGLFKDVVQPEDVIYAKLKSQISRCIVAERLRLGMSQEEFANHIHVEPDIVLHLEDGTYDLSLEMLVRISTILDMDLQIYMTPKYFNCAQ